MNIASKKGFTLVELMVVMLITMFVLYAATQTLGSMVLQFKQQSKITETNIGSILGLEILRRDLHRAGAGLPYSDNPQYNSNTNLPENASPIFSISYPELQTGINAVAGFDSSTMDDGGTPGNPPKAVSMALSVGPNGSDYLVVKGFSIADNNAAGKFNLLSATGTSNTYSTSGANLSSTDRAIVLSPDFVTANSYSTFTLIAPGGVWSNVYNSIIATGASYNQADKTRIIFGLDSRSSASSPESLTSVVAPFNRADYYISYRNVPEKCAHFSDLDATNPTDRTGLAKPGTGVLVKVTMDLADGDFYSKGNNKSNFTEEIPLLDCVADFKVLYRLDTNQDGGLDMYSDGVTFSGAAPAGWTGSAYDIRRNVREVIVFALAHEGAYSRDFLYTADLDADNDPKTIDVGELSFGHVRAANTSFDLSKMDPRWQNFRWKVYELAVKPTSLR